MNQEGEKVISIKKAASMLYRSEEYVRRLCRMGALEAIQYTEGGHWIITREAVERFIERARRNNS